MRKIKVFGTKTPRKTKRSQTIQKAVKRAVNEYQEAYRRLAAE